MPKPNQPEGAPLAEALYWYAEKLMWGYENVQIDQAEAFRLYRQSSDLGFSDATIRVGQLQEFGKGTKSDPRAAVESYKAAAKAGNFCALAFLARLLSRTSHLSKAEIAWKSFFAALDKHQETKFLAASPGELLYDYITTQLRLGLEPEHRAILQRFRLEIIAHHQRLLEHTADARMERLEAASEWMARTYEGSDEGRSRMTGHHCRTEAIGCLATEMIF